MHTQFKVNLIWAIFLVLSTRSLAQPNLSYWSVKVGVIRNLQESGYPFPYDTYSNYPELQIGGALLPSNYLKYGWYFGYWDDGVDEPFPIPDGITYSYNSFIIGGRLDFIPGAHRADLIVQPGIFVGLSHHFIWADYVGGSGFNGVVGQDFRRELNYFEFGFTVSRNLSKSVQVVLEAQQAKRLGEDEFNFPQKRRSLKVGIVYSF